MTGAERFRDAVAGRGVAFAPLVWVRLADLVHQPAEHWWRDPGRAHRLVADAAGVASADAMFVATAADAAAAVCAAGPAGEDGLDELAGAEESRAGCELVERLKAAQSFAVIAAVPGVAWLTERFGVEAPEAAEDALSDMARAYLDAGADALAVIGEPGDDIVESAARAGTAGAYYGRPVLAIRVDDGGGRSGWVETGGSAPISFLSATGEWPESPLGVVTTPGDISAAWDTALLHEAGVARRPRTT